MTPSSANTGDQTFARNFVPIRQALTRSRLSSAAEARSAQCSQPTVAAAELRGSAAACICTR
jgi:hypothetical protein